jgi:trimeric autotransporter adhesin
MIKKLMAAFIMVSVFPVLASAASWTLTTQAKSSGGSITSRNLANQTSGSGSIFKSYTTAAPLSVVVAANTGYGISNVTVNGVVTSAPASPYATTVQGPAAQTVLATFAPSLLSVTASAGAGGTVSPASVANIYYGTKLTAAQVFSFRPQAGFSLVTLSGATGATVSSPLPAPAGTVVTVTFPVGYTFTTPVALIGSFGSINPVADAGAPQTVLTGSLVTLTGSYTGGSGTPPSYTWSQLSGPAVTLAASGNQASFTGLVVGTYQFKVTLDTGSSALTTITVTDSMVTAARTQCQNCHAGSNIGTPALFSNWSASTHKSALNKCANCHVGANSGGHPGPLTRGSVNQATFTYTATGATFCVTCHTQSIVDGFTASRHTTLAALTCSNCHLNGVHNPDVALTACNACHFDQAGQVPLHPVAIGGPCISCHDPHSTVALAGAPAVHFNNVTGAGYPASYMTSRSSCTDCHAPGNFAIRMQWAQSSHAATTEPPWASSDFKTRSGCVQCHTTTGFIAYSTGKVTAAWGSAADKTKEVLTCIGCHSDVANGIVRVVSARQPFADDSYRNRDVGNSNVCMSCHSGRNNGKSIQVKVGVADFANLPFISPHYLAAGSTLHGTGGYHFPGATYAFYSSNSHRQVGLGNLAGTGAVGPCVSCHMSAPERHLFRPLVTDAAGQVTGTSSIVCVDCHSGSLGIAKLNAEKSDLRNALAVLKAMLASKGFVYTPTYPYFTNTNWGSGQSGANVMGAAFNYVLLISEPGAYAHNAQYAKQLVLDSIDYLDNGQLDDSITVLALPNLVASGALSQAAADSFAAYKPKKDSCITCHGGTAASASPMASNSHPAHLTRSYGPNLYLGSDLSSCQTCHYFDSTRHLNGAIDLANSPGSACLNCHAGVAPAWNTAARLACTSCHAANPARLPNGVAAPYKASFQVSGHGRFAASSQCTVCHDPDSRHISGTLGTYMRLRGANDNSLCASCHNNATTVGTAFLNMSSHVTKDGRTLDCRECHDPHGSGNLSMIRSSINGTAIVYTDQVNGLIDPATNRGLCQVCHTLTAHYKAGVPETGHFTSGCLNCHTHNSAGGAFRPVAGGTCDSCHGYPPAPRNTATAFGTTGNWVSARFEDYSGGGGAHLVGGHISPNASPSEGWANCAVCHNAGNTGSTPYHRMTTPVGSNIDKVTVLVDPKLRFSEGFVVYTSPKLVNQPSRNATGSCFNVSCHMSQSPRWSTER